MRNTITAQSLARVYGLGRGYVRHLMKKHGVLPTGKWNGRYLYDKLEAVLIMGDRKRV